MANGNVLASICVALICTGNAFAQSNNKHEHEGFFNINIQTEEDALLTDLKLVAIAKGWSLEEARMDYNTAEAVGAAAEQLAKSHPDLFVGSVLSEQPGGTPSLYIKGMATSAVYNLVAESKINISIVQHQPFSFLELESRANQVQSNLKELGFQDFATSFDFRNAGRIDVLIAEETGKLSSPRQVVSALPKSLRNSVNVVISQGPIGVSELAFGGMRVLDDNTFECTSGWSVENSSGLTGVTTAGHCDGINQIDHPPYAYHPLVHRTQHRGAWGDIEWKTSTYTEPAQFYADQNNNIRNVTALEARANISIGESICMFGRSSNKRDCSLDVSATSVSCTFNGISTQRLVRMDGDVTIGGDSGGGWSFNYKAYGSHVGDCGGLNVFSVADLFDEALGVTVRVQ
ncbi:hypothetical protein KCM76_02535 [Zooshikella marina]|uniref:hypothetical protein n=1 Tax=Zooshikella ganghwensis TaxID=202772 RepID=UPI001BAE61CA|nr:hypothetical protein [Zooshikella ganghwensis]MBU2704839.1 hypothetical protein [Zooshikella ganghwensis]